MERRGLIVKTPVRAREKPARQILPIFRNLGCSRRAGKIAGQSVLRWRSGFVRKRRNEKPVNPLKTNDSAKSRDFAPNDFKDLPFRFISLGETFLSFGARFCPAGSA
jgi:hypothetical protein